MYNFTQDPIDVVIPCHEKDTRTLELAIKGIIENGSNIRKVIVVSEKQLSTIAEFNGCICHKNSLGFLSLRNNELFKSLTKCYKLCYKFFKYHTKYKILVDNSLSFSILLKDLTGSSELKRMNNLNTTRWLSEAWRII